MGSDEKFVDEIEKIRHAYEEAKRSFLNIPVALKEMPKMDPEGTPFSLSYSRVSEALIQKRGMLEPNILFPIFLR